MLSITCFLKCTLINVKFGLPSERNTDPVYLYAHSSDNVSMVCVFPVGETGRPAGTSYSPGVSSSTDPCFYLDKGESY